jgi:hypothetical protein
MAEGSRRHATRAGSALLRAVVAASLAAFALPTASLGATSLSNGQVSPRTATFGQTVTFTVESTGNTNVEVDVQLARSGATRTYVMTATGKSGSATIWSAQSAAVPVGVWAVTFAVKGGMQLAAGKLTINAPPTPTPKPTPKPTPTPTPTPTPKPTPTPTPKPTPITAPTVSVTPSPSASSSPGTSPTASGSAGESPVATGSAGVVTVILTPLPSPEGSPAGSTTGDRTGRLFLAVLLGLFVIGGVAAMAILSARRRRESEEAVASGRTFATPRRGPVSPPRRLVAPPVARPARGAGGARRRDFWEVNRVIEDQPIGTVDELIPDASTFPQEEKPPDELT